MTNFDIIIIGSGLGGLVSAAILAKEGKKVLVLEKNNQLGGNLQSFVRERKIFDTGVHYLGGLLHGQNLHTYFSYLEIMEDLQLERMDPDGFDEIRFGNDPQPYLYAQGKENHIRKLSVHFPEEETSIRAFYDRMEKCCERFPLFLVDGEKDYEVHSDDLEQTVTEVVRTYTGNPKLQAVLMGTQLLYAGEAERTPFYVHALTVFSYIQSAWKCTMGGSQIAKLLAAQIRKSGGEIHKYEEVTKISVSEDGIAKSIQTKTGKVFFADQFISNIHPKQTLAMITGYSLRKSYKKRVLERLETVSSFSVFLVVRPKSIPYRKRNVYFTEDYENAGNLTDYSESDWPSCFMLSMTPSRQNPEWVESISAFTYMKFQEVEAWSASKNTVAEGGPRPPDYLEFKEKKAELLIEKIEKILPDIRENVESIYTASPLSYRDYIGNQKGDLYGFIKNVEQPLHNFNPSSTKIKNLFQTGQHQNMHGILGVTISAVMTCSELLGRKLLLDKIRAFREKPLK